MVAPGVPGILLYLFNLFMGFGDAAVVGPLILAPLGYMAALVIGIPAYLLMASGYAAIAAALFWVIAIGRQHHPSATE